MLNVDVNVGASPSAQDALSSLVDPSELVVNLVVHPKQVQEMFDSLAGVFPMVTITRRGAKMLASIQPPSYRSLLVLIPMLKNGTIRSLKVKHNPSGSQVQL